MMEPVEIDRKGGEYIIVHECVLCGHTKRNKTAQDDNFEAIIQISSKLR